jgi:Domain of unknown function (DUF5615)
MWKELPAVSKADIAAFRGMKRAKLYADEDIEEEIVELIRGRGVNISSARELGHRGKPDSFHAALAFKQKRFLVTKNAKDYMDDRKVPFHRMHGIIAVEGDMRDSDTYIGCLKILLDIIVPFSEVYVKHKIQIKRDLVRYMLNTKFK